MIVEQDGAKFVTVAAGLGAPHRSIQRALERMLHLGLIRRNPGHGHPLRPEYLPTEGGRRVGQAWSTLEREFLALKAESLPRSKWTVPLLAAAAFGQERFGELQESYKGLTPRALAVALRSLCAHGLLDRVVDEGFPPRVSYRLPETATTLRRRLRHLAKETASHGNARR